MSPLARRWLPALCAALASLSATAALGPRYGGELRVGVRDLPASLDPAPPAYDGERLALAAVHETLVGIGPGGYPSPALAESWTSSAGGLEWTLQLRPQLLFHDAQPVTASDVVRSLRRFLRSSSPAAEQAARTLAGGQAFRKGQTDDLPGVDSAGVDRVLLRLDAPRVLPFAPLAAAAAAVTSPAGAGCGPFAPTLQQPTNLVLTAFRGHARGRPFLDAVRVSRLEPGTNHERALDQSDVVLQGRRPGPHLASVLLLVLNPTRAPFDEGEARQLAGQAIDRQELAARLIPGADPTPNLLPAALLPPLGRPAAQAARRQLTGKIELSVARDVPPLVSQRIVAHLSALGLTVSARPVAPGGAPPSASGAHLMLFTPEVPEALLALHQLQRLAPGVPAAHEALEEAATEMDADRRRLALHRAEAALRFAGCLVPLVTVPAPMAHRPGVHGLRVDQGARLILEDAWLEP